MKYALTMHMNISISTAHSHKMETSQMETIPYMETFLIYQTAYYIKQGGFGNFFSVKSLKWKQFPMKYFSFLSFSNRSPYTSKVPAH